MPSTKVRFSLVDYSAEPTSTGLHFEELDDTNYDDLFNPVTGSVSLIQAALLLLTACNHVRTTASIESDTGSGAIPSEPTAQREIALRVQYRDTANAKKYRFDVPGPVSGLYPPQGTDQVPLDNIIAAAFITVFEAQCVSPDGNPVEVVSIRLVGRAS